ncbi:MAG: DUF6722 family protein [Cytophagales bacterium]
MNNRPKRKLGDYFIEISKLVFAGVVLASILTFDVMD